MDSGTKAMTATVYVVIARHYYDDRMSIKAIFDLEERAYDYVRESKFVEWDLEDHNVRR